MKLLELKAVKFCKSHWVLLAFHGVLMGQKEGVAEKLQAVNWFDRQIQVKLDKSSMEKEIFGKSACFHQNLQ
jgi:hypothetical protein